MVGCISPEGGPSAALPTHCSVMWACSSHPGLGTWFYPRSNIELHGDVGRQPWNCQPHTCMRRTSQLKPPHQAKPPGGSCSPRSWQRWSPLMAHEESVPLQGLPWGTRGARVRGRRGRSQPLGRHGEGEREAVARWLLARSTCEVGWETSEPPGPHRDLTAWLLGAPPCCKRTGREVPSLWKGGN